MWTKPENNLNEEDIEDIVLTFDEFYRYHIESALPSQLDFVESLHEQFTANRSLSPKQISALNNIVDACKEYERSYQP